MQLVLISLFSILLSFGCPLWASAPPPLPDPVQKNLPQLKHQGSALLKIFGFSIYQAHLWRQDDKVFALDIHYLRHFTGKQLAERSIAEIRGQGKGNEAELQEWLGQMIKIFADVKEGDRFTGVAMPSGHSVFYFNGKWRGEIKDAQFTEAFFAIWLSEKSSQRKMRDQLLGTS